MALGFGTSGLRGLVTELTDRECVLYTRAFCRHARDQGAPPPVSLAGDLRGSTPRILRAVACAIRQEGGTPEFCGFIPTPALAGHALQRRQAAVMVTGSHIPDDRNGIKFYLPDGEILKADEAAIAARHADLAAAATSDDALAGAFDTRGMFWLENPPEPGAPDPHAAAAYEQRYLAFFPHGCLAGKRIVLYEHSSAARDILGRLLEKLGAQVARVGRSEQFIPVDTEAVANAAQLAEWVRAEGADALVSADGDGDRPLLVDERGALVRGDVLGIHVAAYLRADTVVAPVSCNTALELCGWFRRVVRTRIGSPYVVAALREAVRAGARRAVGFEANGGFLLASEITGDAPGTRLTPLPTRDAALPLLAVLHAAAKHVLRLSQLVRDLPPRFTHSGLLSPFPPERGQALVADIEAGGVAAARRLFGDAFGEVRSLDLTDGARITFAEGDIVHMRPSGNAPEFRVYTEAASPAAAAANNERARELIRRLAETGG
jgi:phosphomannomutase